MQPLRTRICNMLHCKVSTPSASILMQVVPRQIALLPALLLGWASLAACAILPGR